MINNDDAVKRGYWIISESHEKCEEERERLYDELSAVKALLREIKDQCRMADMMQWPNKLYRRLCAALGDKE